MNTKTSRFNGKAYKGAMRDVRAEKRTEAEARNAKADARLRDCGHIHGDAQITRCA